MEIVERKQKKGRRKEKLQKIDDLKEEFKRMVEKVKVIDTDKLKLDLQNVINDIKRKKKEGSFYRNTDQCFNYNSECPYFKICHQEKPDPLTVKLYYTKREDRDGKREGTGAGNSN